MKKLIVALCSFGLLGALLYVAWNYIVRWSVPSLTPATYVQCFVVGSTYDICVSIYAEVVSIAKELID